MRHTSTRPEKVGKPWLALRFDLDQGYGRIETFRAHGQIEAPFRMTHDNSAESFRNLATMCRRQAAASTTPGVAELLREMARKYDGRAERLEESQPLPRPER
ncbi:hypothetical protein [Sphingosinicella sp. BN140058]|uniref:hypothetical protein n=1 Tax=Sphingosinicella sp. BN140058 TaxID=1892855 RepID=UPI001010DD7F|nr:hypothetical protein [Sphingosinicella sp. BN140058]QAY77188.1 hypothetical protein ETR14_12290 [Sphingosinicella sp. BN140058]